jgi:hypothetical protein
MPFVSKAQEAKFYELEREGKISKGTVEEWQRKTKNHHLPEHKGDAHDFDRTVGAGSVDKTTG